MLSKLFHSTPFGADPRFLLLIRTGLGHHPNTSEYQLPAGPDQISRRLHVAASSSAGNRSANRKIRGSSTAAANTEGKIVGFDSILDIDDANIPLSHMQRVADVEELFLPMQV